jgi:hypothetical protein
MEKTGLGFTLIPNDNPERRIRYSGGASSCRDVLLKTGVLMAAQQNSKPVGGTAGKCPGVRSRGGIADLLRIRRLSIQPQQRHHRRLPPQNETHPA